MSLVKMFFSSSREFLKRMLPQSLRDFLRGRPLVLFQLISWNMYLKKYKENFGSQKGGLDSLLIVPPDTYSVMGSRGDDAMVSVVVQQALKRNPNCRIGIVSNGNLGSEGTTRLGLKIESVWRGSSFSAYVRALSRYDAVVVVGADVMDGHYYSDGSAMRYWIMADLAARAGKSSTVVGFSFEYPAPALKTVLNAIHPNVRICVRDEVSFDCFCEFSSAKAVLTSDIAFLLKPSPSGVSYDSAKVWADQQKSLNRTILAVNMRPMHFTDVQGVHEIDLSDVMIHALHEVAGNTPISFMLIPHDFRGADQSDLDILNAVNTGLVAKGHQTFFLDTETTAVELKGIVGLCDIVLTGRMHLGIAAIAQSIPVAAISFQEKFKGFYKLFNLPFNYLVDPIAVQDRGVLSKFTLNLIADQQLMKEKINDALPNVVSMSSENFSELDRLIVTKKSSIQ